MNMLYIIKKIFSGNKRSNNKKPNYVNRIMIKMINKSRRKRGLCDIVYDDFLKNRSRKWSKHMSCCKKMYHGDISGTNRMILEDVCMVMYSRSRTVITTRMFDCWRNSKPHWNAMMHPDVRRVGCSYSVDNSNYVYGCLQLSN
jgi:uncharacterized protein YkwD